MTLVSRSSYREQFWKKYLWRRPTCNLSKKWTSLQLFFKEFSKQLFCLNTLCNCNDVYEFLLLLRYWSFFYVKVFLFFLLMEKTLHWIFWKHCSLFLYAVYHCELGEETPLTVIKMVFLVPSQPLNPPTDAKTQKVEQYPWTNFFT